MHTELSEKLSILCSSLKLLLQSKSLVNIEVTIVDDDKKVGEYISINVKTN